MTLKINFEELKYIFIDFDGTLVDTVPLLFEHYIHFLKKKGHVGSMEEFQSLMGPAIEEFILILKKKYQLRETPEELIQAYTEGLAERYRQGAKLIKDSKQFLDYAKTIGMQLALVTSTAYFLIESTLEALDLKKYFNRIVTGEKVKKTKPDPELYLLALQMFSASPEQALTIEDSYNGILASLSAHIPTVAIKNKHLVKTPPQTMLVENWADLHRVFKVDRNKYEK